MSARVNARRAPIDYGNLKQLKQAAKERKAPVLEAVITDRILKYLNGIQGAKFRKRHGTQYSIGGEPDITGCICGLHVEIEVKRPGEEPTPRQHERLQEWRDAGAIALWVVSLEELQERMIITMRGDGSAQIYTLDRR